MSAKVKVSAVPLNDKLSCSRRAVPFSSPISHCPAEAAAGSDGSFAGGDSSATCTTENFLKSNLVTKPKIPTDNHLCLFVCKIIIALQPAVLIKVNYLDKLKNLCSFTNGHKMKSQLL